MLRGLTIRTLLEQCFDQTLLIPSLQRGFVWKPKQILLLLKSLKEDIPIHSFIFWKTREGLLCKDFTGEPVNTSIKGDKIYVLDGQQRIKSLCILFSKQGIKGVFTPSGAVKIVEEVSVDQIPLYMLLEEGVKTSIDIFEKYSVKKTKELDRAISELLLLIDKDVLYYYELTGSKKIDIFDVFERINTGGTKLNLTELIKCKFTHEWPDFVDEFEKLAFLYKQEKVPFSIKTVIEGFRINYGERYGELDKLVLRSKLDWEALCNAYKKVLSFRDTLPLLCQSCINFCMLYFLAGYSDVSVLKRQCFSFISNEKFKKATDTTLIKWYSDVTAKTLPNFGIQYEKIPKELVLKLVYKNTMKDGLKEKLTEDHIFSKSELKYIGVGDFDNIGNLLLLPTKDNTRKSNMSAQTFYEKSCYRKQLLEDLPESLTEESYRKFVAKRKEKMVQCVHNELEGSV